MRGHGPRSTTGMRSRARAAAGMSRAATEVNAAITAAVNAKKQTQQGQIGLLDEWGGLEQLLGPEQLRQHWPLAAAASADRAGHAADRREAHEQEQDV